MVSPLTPWTTGLACAGAAALLAACGGGEPKDVQLATIHTVAAPGAAAASLAPANVRLTWFGLANWTIKIGELNILVNGTMTRIPYNLFYGGATGMAYTQSTWPMDKAAIIKMNGVLGHAPGSPVNLILTGHSHFHNSFDVPYWALLTHARVIGARSTCYQMRGLGLPATQCTPVEGGESFQLNQYVTMRVVRWNHGGTHAGNPDMHDPAELQKPPSSFPTGSLRAGMFEDFPNGGGSRGYLFTVKTGATSQLSFFITDTGSAADIGADLITDGRNYGKPLNSLAGAMASAKLKGVDLWLGTGGQPLAAAVVPLLKPKAWLANDLGNDFVPFGSGNTLPFQDPDLAAWLGASHIALVPPAQYMDAFVLDAAGLRPVDNSVMKKVYRF